MRTERPTGQLLPPFYHAGCLSEISAEGVLPHLPELYWPFEMTCSAVVLATMKAVDNKQLMALQQQQTLGVSAEFIDDLETASVVDDWFDEAHAGFSGL